MSSVGDIKGFLKAAQPLDKLAENMRKLFEIVTDDENTIDDTDNKDNEHRKKVLDAILLYGYNGVGKTRLSMEFKEQGENGTNSDTLYFNAFTEDLFTWENADEKGQANRLHLKPQSRFISGAYLGALEKRIYDLMGYHVSLKSKPFKFKLDTTTDNQDWTISFYRPESGPDAASIKISRGEERLFIWCYFLAILQYALDGDDAYSWVKYIYIDDPITSLDDNNVVALACQFVNMFKNRKNKKLKLIVSTHHSLFYNVMYYELRKNSYTYLYNSKDDKFIFKDSDDSPFLHHIALLAELKKVSDEGNLFTYHFNILRVILEKTARFYGLDHFSQCLVNDNEEQDKEEKHLEEKRLIDLMSHGKYSVFEPREMVPDNKTMFKNVLDRFLERHPFHINPLKKTLDSLTNNCDEEGR